MGTCFGVRAPHDGRPAPVLVRFDGSGRRAFLCPDCVVALDEVGVRAAIIADERTGPQRRKGPGKRRADQRLGALAGDRRATWR